MGTLAETSPGPGRTVFGDRKVNFFTWVFSNSYTTGGEALTLAQLGLKVGCDFFFAEQFLNAGLAKYVDVIYDRVNQKVIAVNNSTGVEVIATTNLSTETVRIMAIGR